MKRGRSNRIAVGTWIIMVAMAAGAGAQEDRAAGLFTRARQLPLVEQSAELTVVGGEATLHLVQDFFNDGPDEGQADYRLHLPDGAEVTAFGFWKDGRLLTAELKERRRAEAEHRRAADSHRATGLLKIDGRIVSFSVYPLAAGERQRVEVTVLLPVVTQRGRSAVTVPVDWFLGHRRITTPVLVDILSEQSIAGFGAEGRRVTVLGREEREVRFAFSTAERAEVWFSEDLPPLLAAAEAVPLPEGGRGLQLRLMLNDAGEWARPAERIALLVDVSASMGRRRAQVRRVLERLARGAPVPVEVVAVGDSVRELGRLDDPGEMDRELFSGADYGSSWDGFVEAASAHGCGMPEVRCLALTDPQLPGLGPEEATGVRRLFLADSHELDFFEKVLGAGAAAYRQGVDPVARLDALADAAVLPVIAVDRVLQDGRELELLASGPLWAPLGSMLRLYAAGGSEGPLEVEGRIDGNPVAVTVEPTPVSAVAPEGRAVRRSVYRELLASWIREWRNTRDGSLRARIVELSLREGIPTEFTALHVADPRLSLGRFRPGDPILTVPAGEDVVGVTAWYPFGRHVALQRDPGTGAYSDRFLVPRGWRDGGYRVRVALRHADGRIEEKSVWYRLDSRGPDALLSVDEEAGRLLIDTGDATEEIGAVWVFTADMRQLSLAPVGTCWAAPLDELGERFTVVLRDRATNRTVIRCRLSGGRLALDPVGPERRQAAGAREEVVEPWLSAACGPLTLADGVLRLDLPGRTVAGPLGGVPRSLRLTCVLDRGGEILAGTAGGDILRFPPSGEVEVLATGYPDHPVTGLAVMDDGTVLAGVLGGGLLEVAGDGRVVGSRLHLGTRFVTALLRHRGTVFAGTSGRGLWRIVNGKPIRTRYPESMVTGLESTGRGLVVRSIHTRYLRRGCDRFEPQGPVLLAGGSGSPDLTAAVRWEGRLVAGRLQGGLGVVEAGGLVPLEVDLGLDGGRVNDLAVLDGDLWVASEGGVFRIGEDGPQRVLPFPALDLDADGGRLAVASHRGVWVIESGGEPQRWDLQAGSGSEALAAVAWWRGILLAGGRDGLWGFSGPGAGQLVGAGAALASGNVVALLADGDGVLVGTSDRGLFRFDGWRVRPVKGLEDLWVAQGGLSRARGSVWVGAVGMPPVRLAPDGAAARVRVPARDVYRAVEAEGGGLWLLTSDGLMRLSDS